MYLKRVGKFTTAVSKGLLETQRTVLRHIVCGIFRGQCLLLAEIARCLESEVAFGHRLKRVWRFVDNQRLHQPASKEVVARNLIRQLHHRLRLKPHQPLEIIIDWTSVWPYQVLSALIPVQGRAVPVLSWAVAQWDFATSQNQFEADFIEALRRCVPRSWTIVIVADRGFQRTEFLQQIAAQGFKYVIRVKGDAWIESGQYQGKLRDYPLQVGQTFKLSHVVYHKTKRYRLKLVLNCARIKGKVSSWLLATNLPHTAGQIVQIYRRRFWCEESFRDQKQAFQLEGVRVQTAARLENLLLALAIVLLILAIIGLRANKLGYAELFCTRKQKQATISWLHLALDLLRESSKFLNLLFDNKGGTFYFRWA